MKTVSAALQAHLAAPITTLCTIVKIIRKDSQVFGFTDHDQDITFEGTTYKSFTGYTSTDIKTEVALNVDNVDIEAALNSTSFTETDIIAGKWDYADVRMALVNWADLSQGSLKLRRGTLGQISVTRSFGAELRGMAQWLQQSIGEVVSETCKADLFDARCKVVDTEGVWKFSNVAVSTIVAAQRQFTATALTQAVDFFTAGKIEWQTGANATLKMEVKTHATGGDILLQTPMPYTIAIGDTFRIWAGCRKRYSEDCHTKFSNTINFRGFPFVPGESAIQRIAQQTR